MDVDVLVVGAGLAGASAARSLHDAGRTVLALDKGRGPGGRLSTRRAGTGSFDHGAAWLQARTPAFDAWLSTETAAGRAGVWRSGHVGIPGMNALVAGLLDGLAPRWSVAVAVLRHDAGRWCAVDADGRVVGVAPAVVLAIPAPQAATLLRNSAAPLGTSHAAAAMALAGIRYSPCWAALLAVDVEAAGRAGERVSDDVVEAIYREADKPGRADSGHWVVHASAEWSEANLEADAGDIARRLKEAFVARTGVDAAAIRNVSAHRWRYARPLDRIDPVPLEASGLVFAGDAFGPPETSTMAPAERAWVSGRAAAKRLLAEVQPKS